MLGLERPSLVITIHSSTSQVYLQKLAYLGKKSLLPLQQQTHRHKNSPTSFSSVFLGSNRGKPEINKIEGDKVRYFSQELLNISAAALELMPSTFLGQIGGTIGFAFFFNNLLCV